jgi:transposase InsO family protein
MCFSDATDGRSMSGASAGSIASKACNYVTNRPRRVKAKLREDRFPATAPNQVWAMDFVHDQLFDGRKIRVLTIVDTFTRLAPAIGAR